MGLRVCGISSHFVEGLVGDEILFDRVRWVG